MTTLGYKQSYRRTLPHIQPVGAALFVTFRLHESFPTEVANQLAVEKSKMTASLAQLTQQDQSEAKLQYSRKAFGIAEDCVDGASTGPTWLKRTEIAEVVAEALHHRDGKIYDLDAYCIMSNHVHVVFRPIDAEHAKNAKAQERDITVPSLARIMQSLKGNTARKANRILNRTGDFWAHESFDHYVRNEKEYQNIIRYVLNNPVKAGLVKEWSEWRWSYLRSATGMAQANSLCNRGEK